MWCHILGVVLGCVFLCPLFVAEIRNLPLNSVCGTLEVVLEGLPDCSVPNAIPSVVTNLAGVKNCCTVEGKQLVSECCPKVGDNVMCDTGYNIDACKCKVMNADDECNFDEVEKCCYDGTPNDMNANYVCCPKIGVDGC